MIGIWNDERSYRTGHLVHNRVGSGRRTRGVIISKGHKNWHLNVGDKVGYVVITYCFGSVK